MTGLLYNCQVERCILWRSGYSNLAGKITWENEDYKIQPHDAPLFTEREQRSGVCNSCFSGWSHPDNSPTGKGQAQIAAAAANWFLFCKSQQLGAVL